MLGLQIEAGKPPRNDLNMTSVIEMAEFYDARGLFWPHKTPEHDQFLKPKCREVDLYGEMGCIKFSNFFHHVVVTRVVPDHLTLT